MVDAVLAVIPSNARALCERILAERPAEPEVLRAQVKAHGHAIDAAAHARGGDLDVHLADHVERACLSLLDGLGPTPASEPHRLVHLACRYFVLDDDDEGDLDSVLGLDDDAAVLNAVVDALGRPDLAVVV